MKPDNEFDEIICRVCGVDWSKSINSTRDMVYDDACPCCGSQVGYVDKKITAIRKARAIWLESDLSWYEGKDYEPEGWGRDMALKQLENIPEEFR